MKTILFLIFIFTTNHVSGQEGEVEDPLFEDEEVIDQIEQINNFSDQQFDLEPFIYSQKGRKSPFEKPPGVDAQPVQQQAKGVVTKGRVQLSGLEGYDVDTFKVTTILWDIERPQALVKSPNNETYVLEEGTKIGRSNGYVAKIREGEVVIIEVNYPNGEDGRKLYTTQVLKLGR